MLIRTLGQHSGVDSLCFIKKHFEMLRQLAQVVERLGYLVNHPHLLLLFLRLAQKISQPSLQIPDSFCFFEPATVASLSFQAFLENGGDLKDNSTESAGCLAFFEVDAPKLFYFIWEVAA